MINEIEALQAFAPVYGLPSWQVKHGHDSFLTFEFGEPIVEVHDKLLSETVASTSSRTSARSIGWNLR